MSRWVRITITEALVLGAVRYDCYRCLIALALRQATGQSWHVMGGNARNEDSAEPLWWQFPPTVSRLVRRFDAGDTLSLVGEVLRIPRRFVPDDQKRIQHGED